MEPQNDQPENQQNTEVSVEGEQEIQVSTPDATEPPKEEANVEPTEPTSDSVPVIESEPETSTSTADEIELKAESSSAVVEEAEQAAQPPPPAAAAPSEPAAPASPLPQSPEQQSEEAKKLEQRRLKQQQDLAKRREADLALKEWETRRRQKDAMERHTFGMWFSGITQRITSARSLVSEMQKAMKERANADAAYVQSILGQTKLVVAATETGTLKEGWMALSSLSSQLGDVYNEFVEYIASSILDQVATLGKTYQSKSDEVLEAGRRHIKDLDDARERAVRSFTTHEEVFQAAIEAERNGERVSRDPWLTELLYRKSLFQLSEEQKKYRGNMSEVFKKFTKLDEWRIDSVKAILSNYITKQQTLHSKAQEALSLSLAVVNKIDAVSDRQAFVKQNFQQPQPAAAAELNAPMRKGSKLLAESSGLRRGSKGSKDALSPTATSPTTSAPSGSTGEGALSPTTPTTEQNVNVNLETMAVAANDSEPPRSVGVIKRGPLQRQSTVIKSWKQAFFVLTIDGFLHYFASGDDTEPEASIALANSTLHTPELLLRENGFEIVENPDSFLKSVFKVTNRYVLRATSEEEMVDWCVAIKDKCLNATSVSLPNVPEDTAQ